MLIDTETCPIDREVNEVNPNNMLVYDIGYRVVDLNGNCYVERSFIVDNVFFGEYKKMRNAYYYNKLKFYFDDLAKGNAEHLEWSAIREIIRNDLKEYGINEIVAHNARFDCISLNATAKYLNEDYIFPFNIVWWDTMKMFNSTIGQYKKYKKFCFDNGYVTKHRVPRPQVKAEVIYKYLTKDTNFVEEHRALQDARIETEIMKACFKTHRKMERLLWK